RAVTLSRGRELSAQDFQFAPARTAPADATEASPPRARPAPPPATVDEELRDGLVQRLAASGGNVAEVARSYGKARAQVHRWLRRFGIDPSAFRRRAS